MTSKSTHAPLEFASVTISGYGIVCFPMVSWNIQADAEGHFHTVVKAGQYEILITAPRYLTQKNEIHLRGGESVILNVDMNRGGP